MATNNATNTSNPITVAQGGTGLATLTAHSVQVGNGTGTVTQLSVGSNGQLLCGSTGADPAFTTLTSTGSTVTYTTGAHTLNVDVTNAVKVVATDNTGAGSGALANVTVSTGNENTAFGFNALNACTTALRNTAVGSKALASITTASTNNNTAVGYNALNALSSGAGNNTAIGQQCLASTTSDFSNVGIGLNCLFSLNGGGSGISNVGIGVQSLQNLTSGASNMTMGYQSGFNMLTGGFNIMLGDSAGLAYTGSESSNILLNSQGVVGESHVVRIGQASGTGQQQINKCFIAGINGVTVGVSGVPVVIDNTNQLGTVVSSARFKENIQDMNDDSSAIHNLRPVTFNYKLDQNKSKQVGLIAEEVQQIMPNMVTYDLEGNIQAVKYHDLVPMLLNELIKLKQEVELLKKS